MNVSREFEQPNAHYRVSVKALIRDTNANLLVVKEHGHQNFSLPGGGIDHGESLETALKRELREEVGYDDSFTYKIIDIVTFYVEEAKAWYMWIACEVSVDESSKFTKGVDGDEIAWKSIDEIEDETRAGRLIHEVYLKLDNQGE